MNYTSILYCVTILIVLHTYETLFFSPNVCNHISLYGKYS
jgi:hypothetical protein